VTKKEAGEQLITQSLAFIILDINQEPFISHEKFRSTNSTVN
jgi:hypothetical protein